MRSVAAKEAKDHFGQLVEDARREPVAIVRHGRRVAVVLSPEAYERLNAKERAGLSDAERAWLEENGRSIAKWNDWVERQGLPLDGQRLF